MSGVQKNSVLNTHNAHTRTLYMHTCIYTHMYIRVSAVQKNPMLNTGGLMANTT